MLVEEKMKQINPKLIKYVENNIFPQYDKNEAGHGINHIKYVINRSIKFSEQFENINLDMLYVAAAFHDLAHYIDKDRHEILSAKLFYEDEKMKEFFSEKQRLIIKEAIEDHRASSKTKPRSDYGKIISSADRNVEEDVLFKRTHAYTCKYYPNTDLCGIIIRAYNHMVKKFGVNGYATNYCYDKDYEKFKANIIELSNDIYSFAVKYMKANNIMDIKEKARFFAIRAHKGQVRKNEKDKPMIIHPISVGTLLRSYGYDDNVVAAGYLHDVVEDTKYTIEDIKEEFGSDIATLVMKATESDKSLSWEERKKHTIEEIKTMSLREKLVVCADKIDNLEDMFFSFGKNGAKDFSNFKRGEKEQRWYYTTVYETLILGEDEKLPIFARLKSVLDKVFYYEENTFFKDVIFEDNVEYYAKLKKLQACMFELKKLKSIISLDKPFVIEFTGTPRTGKTSILNNLLDFFRKSSFNTTLLEEFTTSKHYKENLKEELEKMESSKRDIIIIEKVSEQLKAAISSDYDIILVDRSINDRQIWNYRRLKRNEMSEDKYYVSRDKYKNMSKELIDCLFILYTDPVTALKRDYNNSLSLENRRFLNIENLEEYNNCLNELNDLFVESVNNFIQCDATKTDINDLAIEIAFKITTILRKKYIDSFNKKYNLVN